VLFFLMLFVPTTYTLEKAILLGFIITVVLGDMALRRKLALHPTVLWMGLFFVWFGALLVDRGVSAGNPGAVPQATVYVLWPALYLVLISGLRHHWHFTWLIRTAVYSTIAIDVYALTYILSTLHRLPAALYVPLDAGQLINFDQGPNVGFALNSVASLTFLLPFLVALALVWPSSKPLPIRRPLIWIGLLLGGVVAAVSGRRGLLVVVVLSVPVSLLLARCLPRDDRPTLKFLGLRGGLMGLAAIAASPFVFGSLHLDPTSLFSQFLTGFDFQTTGTSNAALRGEQFTALLTGWASNPLFGSGIGAVAPGIIRSTEQPWSYELYYVAELFNIGLTGVLVYAVGLGWILRSAARAIGSGALTGLYLLPVMAGSVCFLAASATNPYIGKYDSLFVIFLPVALINYWLIEQRAKASTVKHKRLVTSP
jgi:hypothetical protein